MNINPLPLDPYLQRQIDSGSSGLDVIHGHLKGLMLEAERQLALAQEAEEESGEAIDSMERTYWEGQVEALTSLYVLTYNISFAIQERNKNAVI